MTCNFCGNNEAHIRRVTETYGKGKNLLVIKNIPIVSCSDCGQSYFIAETLHEIERIRLHHKSLAIKCLVGVVKFE